MTFFGRLAFVVSAFISLGLAIWFTATEAYSAGFGWPVALIAMALSLDAYGVFGVEPSGLTIEVRIAGWISIYVAILACAFVFIFFPFWIAVFVTWACLLAVRGPVLIFAPFSTKEPTAVFPTVARTTGPPLRRFVFATIGALSGAAAALGIIWAIAKAELIDQDILPLVGLGLFCPLFVLGGWMGVKAGRPKPASAKAPSWMTRPRSTGPTIPCPRCERDLSPSTRICPRCEYRLVDEA
jgi:hypothetical protein